MQYRCLISPLIAHRKATTYSFSKVMPKVHFAKKIIFTIYSQETTCNIHGQANNDVSALIRR